MTYEEAKNHLIVRKSLLAYINNAPSELTADGRRMIRREAVIDYINSMETIKFITGRWIKMEREVFCGLDDKDNPICRYVPIYRCSKCKRKTIIKENFCPSCGCCMEVEDAE